MEWARDYVLFCHMDTQVKGEKYPNLLLEKKGISYHNFMFMNSEGIVLGRYTGPFGTEYLEKAANGAKRFLVLREQAARGEQDAIVDHLLRRVELLHLTAPAARKELKGLTLSATNRKLADLLLLLHARQITSAEVRTAMNGLSIPRSRQETMEPRLVNAEADEILRLLPPDPEARKPMAMKLKEMADAGRVPSEDAINWNFWRILMEHAEAEGDAGLFEKALRALDAYRKAYWEMPAVVRYFERKEKALERLKKEGR